MWSWFRTAVIIAIALYPAAPPTGSVLPNPPMPQWTKSIELIPAESGAVPTR